MLWRVEKVFHAFFICSVNVFIILTGYFMCKKNCITLDKTLLLYLQNTFFSLGLYLIAKIIKNSSIGVSDILLK